MTTRRTGAFVQVLLGVAWALGACTPAPVNNGEPRYPEKRQPPPLRSASDGEVMGANKQSIDDTLEGSPTNLHPAPGWEGEKGAAERAKDSDCVPEATAAGANAQKASTPANGHPRSGKPCPKPKAP